MPVNKGFKDEYFGALNNSTLENEFEIPQIDDESEEYYDLVDMDYDFKNDLIITKYDTPMVRFQKEDKNKIEAKLRRLQANFNMKLYNEILEDLDDYVQSNARFSYDCWSNFDGMDEDRKVWCYDVDCKMLMIVYNKLKDKLDSISKNYL